MADDPQVRPEPIDQVIRQSLRWLRQLSNAHDTAWSLNLDYGPSAVDYQPTSAGRAQSRPAEGTIIRYGRDDQPAVSALSTAYVASVDRLATALVAASELSWTDDNIAQHSVRPRGQSHYPKCLGDRMVRLLDRTLTQADDADWQQPLGMADNVHLRSIAGHVHKALTVMPDDLWVDGSRRRVCNGLPRLVLGDKQQCTTMIPKSHSRCATCRQRLKRARDASAEQKSA